MADGPGGRLLALDTQMDKFIRFLEGWQAETESKNNAIRVSEAMRQMARQGKWSGGRPPYGFRLAPGRRPKSEAPALEIDPEQARVIDLMVGLYLEQRMGGLQIARELNRRGVANPGGRPWDDQKVRRILQNPIIAGLPAYDRTRPCGQSVTRKNPYRLEQFILPRDAEGNLQPVAAYQIIPLDRWLTLIRAMQCAKTPPRSGDVTYTLTARARASDALLTGIVFCGHCGARLSAETERGERLFYICQTKYHQGAEHCDGQRTYGARRLEGEVLAQISRLDPALLPAPASQVLPEAPLPSPAEVARARRVLDGWLARMDAFLGAPEESPYSEEMLVRKIREARARAEALARPAATPVASPAVPQSWQEAFAAASVAEKKLLLRNLIDRVTVRRGEVAVSFRSGARG